MKQAATVFLLLFFSLSLWAQEDPSGEENPDDGTPRGAASWDDDDKPPPPQKKYVLKNRVFELSLVNFNIDASNSFAAAGDIIRDPLDMIKSEKFFKDSVSINLNDFFHGFTLLFGTTIDPVSLNFNWQDKWGFGLDIGRVNAAGNVTISENVLSFKETDNEKFGAGGAVFVDVGIPVFFHWDEVKIKIRPSVYLPVVYAEPGITYSYRQIEDPDTGNSGMRWQADFNDTRVYSVFGLQNLSKPDFGAVGQELLDNAWDIAGKNLGYDFSIGAEYPLYDWLDIGVDIINIPVPFANARLNRYMQVTGQAYFDTSLLDLTGMFMDNNGLPDNIYGMSYDISYNDDGSKEIYRPFKTLFYAKCRPFEESPGFSLIPSLGFSLSNIYTQFASIEGGLSARWDVSNMLITTLGINYNDRKWKNGVDFVLNLRVFELDLGISSQSSDFLKSWQGAGLGAVFGIKLGW